MEQFVSASYPDEEQAKAAVEALEEAHFANTDISVARVDGDRAEEIPIAHKTWIPHGIAIGGAIGALVGGVVGALMATGRLANAMWMIAAGPVVAALFGALIGAMAGAFAGAYGGIGWWKHEPDFDGAELKDGAVVVGVTAPEARVDEARSVLARSGGRHVRA